MEKLQEVLNITDSNGQMITFFDGRISASQLVAIVIAIIAVLLVLKIFKKIMRGVVILVIISTCLIYCSNNSPEKLLEVTKQISIVGSEAYKKFDLLSDSIKIEDNKVKVLLNDTWYNINDIKYRKEDGIVTVIVDGKDIVVDDDVIISLLETFK